MYMIFWSGFRFYRLLMALVVMANLPVVLNLPSKICLYKLISAAAASPYYSNVIVSEYIFCTFTHIAGQHYLNTHIVKNWSNVRFASATLR